MKAVVTTADEQAPLIDKDIAQPNLTDHDVLVKVSATAMNPVDIKQLEGAQATQQERVLGFDAVGEIVSVGGAVVNYQIGDRVFFAGELGRTGANAEFEAVCEDLIAKAPTTLSDIEAAALPLTFLTA